MKDPLPVNALCERCWSRITPDQPFARLGHVVGSTLTGDVRWAYTYLHHRDVGCPLVTPPPGFAAATPGGPPW